MIPVAVFFLIVAAVPLFMWLADKFGKRFPE